MMAGVVRRDGLREAVTALRDKWVADEGRTWISNCGDELTLTLDAVPDVPPTEWSKVDPIAGGNTDVWRCEEELCGALVREAGRDAHRLAFHMPDVPPDPPAADRDELVIGVFQLMDLDDPRPMDHAREWVDAMFAEGVLVDAADVRARAQVDTLRELADFFMRRDGPGYVVEEICRRIEGDRAVSEREGTT